MKDRKKKEQKQRKKRTPVLRTSDAERCLWDILRDRQVAGARFLRRFPMGRLVVDFVCREHRLAVVIDGPRRAAAARDEGRDQSIAARGYRLLRFDETAILRHPERIRSAVAAQLESSDASEGHNE